MRLLGERREDTTLIDEGMILRRNGDRLGHQRIAYGHGLGRRGRLQRLLHDRAFVDADERLAVRAIEDVDPTRFARLREALAKRASVLRLEQDDWIRCVVIPEVMVNLLEVPPVSPRGHVQRNDGCREQIVAGSCRTPEARPRIARGEVEQSQIGIDGRSAPHRRATPLPHLAVGGPTVVAELTRSGHGVELPDRLA